MTSLVELAGQANEYSRRIDEGVKALTRTAAESAEAERVYRLERAKAWATTSGTAREREDAVNAATADQRYARDLAEAGRQAALEALRSRRQQLSAVQSIAAAFRSEAELGRYGSQEHP